jgi:type I restriction enzyme M protein
MQRDDFGYRRITVEQPLRRRYTVVPDAVEKLRESPAFIKLAVPPKNSADPPAAVKVGEQAQEELVKRLTDMAGYSGSDHSDAEKKVKALVADLGVKAPKAVSDAIWAAISVPDQEAPPVTDRHGKPRPDPNLRDHENVPLSEDVEHYMKREVWPWVPDAWYDPSKDKVGYEIPLTRIFYEPEPTREVADIDADIRRLEGDIAGLLRQLLP